MSARYAVHVVDMYGNGHDHQDVEHIDAKRETWTNGDGYAYRTVTAGYRHITIYAPGYEVKYLYPSRYYIREQ